MQRREETPAEKTYLRYALAYTVTLGVGLAPMLGKIHVPGFSSIAELFPQNLQRSIIPFATFLMAIPVMVVHFIGSDRIRVATLKRWFIAVLPMLVVLPLVLFYLYESYVVQVDFEGGRGSASYIVGERMLPDCPCATHHMDIGTCVAQLISANPTAVTACYPRAEINARRAALAIVYLPMMLAFGTLIALIMLKEAQNRRRHAAAAQTAPAS